MAEQHTLTITLTGDSSQLIAEIQKAQTELNNLLTMPNVTNPLLNIPIFQRPPTQPLSPEDNSLAQSTINLLTQVTTETDQEGQPITPASPIRDDLLTSLQTAQEIVTTLEELQPPELTPARMGLVSGDVADVGSLEVVNMIDAKLKEISGKIYKVNMTVELDARIRTGAGFKIIPITMAEIQSDLRAASNILRTPLGQ